jgi:hypothetical protein
MPVLDRLAAWSALLSGGMLLVDVVVITILDDSWGTPDNLLWSGTLLLAPFALVLSSLALARGRQRSWLVAPLLLVGILAVMAGLGYLFQELANASGSANLGLVWEASNYAFALVLLALGIVVLRRPQSRSSARAR